MKFAVLMAAVSVLLLMLLACATPTPSVDWSQERFMQSPTRFGEDQLLLEQDGWQVWRLYKKYDSRCIAIKPAEGRNWPELSWQTTPVSGGAGFYMQWEQDQTQAYFGFYGAHPFGRVVLVWHNGESVFDINQRETVLAWQGQTLAFRVSSQPQEGIYSEGLSVDGELDFSGVQQAYAALTQCHQKP